ncbi:uncharacterized protein LOC124275837 [Haliotis rubra]|uniref:uncharacterized protein LOC124275837 n=1 Tax=Haliotis rubra TaxID=36100 RepID=UPI001EE56ED6|nr:uncharacterized protein LOC124275837 [Haliotis rubra]
MDLIQVICVFLLSLICTCRGRAWPYADRINFVGPDPAEQLPRCPRENKPCKVLVREYYGNGTLKQETRSGSMCMCEGGMCPTEWDQNPERSVTRFLHTPRGSETTLQLKFCQTVHAERICHPHEVALSLKGRSILPQEVTSINCRCSDNRPLHLQSVLLYEHTYERHQNFVCSMPDCAHPPRGSATCQLNFQNSTRRENRLLCKCPGNKQCRSSSQSSHGAEYTFGYCTDLRAV